MRAFKRSKEGLRIDAAVVVSRDSQKGILIGKAGKGIQALRTASRQSLRSFFGTRVDLDMTVKLEKASPFLTCCFSLSHLQIMPLCIVPKMP